MVRLLGFAWLVAACSSSTPPVLTTQPANELTYGAVQAQATDSVTGEGGNTGYTFGASLTPLVAATTVCEGATLTVGACCYVPPVAAAPGAEPNIGELDLGIDSETIGTISWGPNPGGPPGNNPEEYDGDLLNPTHWNSGDSLEISGGGEGSFAAFDATVPGVDLPDAANGASISRAASLAFTWTPDPNAHSMTVTLQSFDTTAHVDHGTVGCILPDAAGSVAIDASLLQAFVAGDTLWGFTTREVDRYVDLGDGYITIASQGVHEFIVPVD